MDEYTLPGRDERRADALCRAADACAAAPAPAYCPDCYLGRVWPTTTGDGPMPVRQRSTVCPTCAGTGLSTP